MTEPAPPTDERAIRFEGFDGEWIWRWIAWHLPKRLVYWCAVRVGAHATVGAKYGRTIVPELRMMEALDRWPK